MKTCQNKSLLIIKTVAIGAIVVISFGCTGTIGIQAEYKVFDKDGPRPLFKHEVYLLRNSITSEEMEEVQKIPGVSNSASSARNAVDGEKRSIACEILVQ